MKRIPIEKNGNKNNVGAYGDTPDDPAGNVDRKE